MIKHDFIMYDPRVAERIIKLTQTQPHTAILAATLYEIINENQGDTDKVVQITPKELAKYTMYNETQVKTGMQTLLHVGLVKNLTKNGVQTTGASGMDKFYGK